jgi:hypothetical protein
MPAEADQGAASDRARFFNPRLLEGPYCRLQATVEV